MKTELLGVMFDDITLHEAVEAAMGIIAQGGFHYAVTPNAEFVQLAQRDPAFRTLLNGADLVLPDGIGVVYAAKILGRPIKGRVPGVDFAASLMAEMAKQGNRLFLLGAKPGVAEKAAGRLAAEYRGLQIAGLNDGYFSDSGVVADKIKDSGADVVFVCLGAPKQEQFMKEYGARTGASLLVGLGGSLDVFAGEVQRAPQGWQNMGCEWLYRLLKQPSRIGRMAKLPLFLVSAVKERIRGA
ncbi:MAG: N-acetylmannosaminyltransferase [Oscillospiraceae bacterium]|nr:N-acetylmannosaminyltransferase [Oscillospiraceae bacterium]